MNRSQHISIGLIFLIITFLILDYFNLLNYLQYAVMISIGSIIPDIIEPAKDYTHRKFFHSKKLLKYLVYGLLISFILGLMINKVFYIFFLIIGYILHLGVDATTKMGLPES